MVHEQRRQFIRIELGLCTGRQRFEKWCARFCSPEGEGRSILDAWGRGRGQGLGGV